MDVVNVAVVDASRLENGFVEFRIALVVGGRDDWASGVELARLFYDFRELLPFFEILWIAQKHFVADGVDEDAGMSAGAFDDIFVFHEPVLEEIGRCRADLSGEGPRANAFKADGEADFIGGI